MDTFLFCSQASFDTQQSQPDAPAIEQTDFSHAADHARSDCLLSGRLYKKENGVIDCIPGSAFYRLFQKILFSLLTIGKHCDTMFIVATGCGSAW